MVCAGLIAMALLSWSEEYTDAIRTYEHLFNRMFSEGWFEYSESGEFIVHEAFKNWAGHHEYGQFVERLAELGAQIAQYGDTDDIPESLKAEYTQTMNEINAYLADFLGTDTDQLTWELAEASPSPEEAEATAEQASFNTANITAEGDAAAIDRVRFPLQNIQGYYDTIARHLESGGYSLAQRNIDNLIASLASLGAEVAELRGRHRLSITFHGLPGDGAMEDYRELEEEWDQNYRLWEYVQKTVHDLDNAILQGELSYVNVVWRGAYQSMLDWHSPPSWYEVPQTFHQWYRDAEERGGAIFEAGQAVRRMRLTRNELDRIRSIALDTHEEIKESLEEMDPVTGMDSQLRSLFGGLGWAGFVPAS